MTATAPSPIDYPHLRERPTLTLSDLHDQLAQNVESLRVESGESIRISDDRTTVRVNTVESQVTDDALEALANWVDFPKAFLQRLDPDLQASWLNEMLRRKHDSGVVRLGQRSGIVGVLKPNQIPFEPSMIVDVAQRVLGANGTVVESGNSSTAFWLDCTIPITGKGSGNNLGDPKVGDITKAGLRFDVNTAQNLAPSVSPYSYRLWCTNGASSKHAGTKIDARGQTVDEVIVELEAKARLAFGLVEQEVAAMYDLRNTIVPHPEREISRLAREQRMPDRTRLHLLDALPSLVQDMNHVSMFEIIQAATHIANAGNVTTRGGRLSLENFAGSVISDHAERCTACRSRLN